MKRVLAALAAIALATQTGAAWALPWAGSAEAPPAHAPLYALPDATSADSDIFQSQDDSPWRTAPACSPSETPREPVTAQHPLKLAAPPAGILLMLQGILCIGLFRGRRKCIALLIALLSVGRTGITGIPQLSNDATTEHSGASALQEGMHPSAQTPTEDLIRAQKHIADLVRQLTSGRLDSASGERASALVQARTRDELPGLGLKSCAQPVALSPSQAIEFDDTGVIAATPAIASLSSALLVHAQFARPPPLGI